MYLLKLLIRFLPLLNIIDSVPILSVNSTSMTNYLSYIHDYGKEYNITRYELFKENVKKIEDHNEKNLSYELEINEFTDIPKIEHTTYKYHEGEYNNFNNIVPFSVDWRKKNVVSDVKNQGKCGSCWAFSATGSVEGIIAIKEGTLFNISEQQLMDCSSSYGNHGCRGGSMDSAFKYIIDNGICSEKEYPYEGTDGGDCNPCKTVVKINNYKDIESNNEKILKRAVAQHPVSVAIEADQFSFQHYSNGVFSDQTCGTKLDHGVLIVGYGYDLSSDMDYWLVKNSWGDQWGEDGYIRIQRNINNSSGLCGIAMMPSIPLLEGK